MKKPLIDEEMSTDLSIQFEGSNLGNLKKIRLIDLSKLSFIPDVKSGLISYNDLEFVSGSAFQDIYFTPETGYFNEPEQTSGSGSSFDKEIGFDIPKVRSELIAGLKSYENRKNCALVTDGNDNSFLVFPLRISRKKQIPGQISSKNAISIILKGRSIYESPVITDIPVV